MASASQAEWADRLRALVPGCADFARCRTCAAWDSAAATVATVPATRSVMRTAFVRQAVAVCRRASTLGFYPHQPRHVVDAVEEGSLDPAPDDAALEEALARAQAAVDDHADADMSGGRVPPPGQFTGAVLWPNGVRPPTPPRFVTSIDTWAVSGVEALARTIVDDLASGALVSASPLATTTAFIASPEAKPRVCVNLRPVNEAMAPSTVSYPTARDLALGGREWFVKIDLKAAFKRVGVPAAALGWLGFEVAGLGLTYHALPFGWAWSPEIFAAALAPVVEEVRRQGVAVVAYVDDFAIAGRSPVEAVEGATVALAILRANGWIVAPSKAFLRPVRGLRFLGVLVRGGRQPALALMPATAGKLLTTVERAADRRCFREVLRAWGLTSFAASVWPHLALARASLDEVAAAVIAADGALCRQPAAVEDADWSAVLSAARHAAAAVAAAVDAGWHPCRTPVHLAAPLRIASDASAWAVGAVMAVGGVLLVASRPLAPDEMRLPSSVRELLAIEHAIDHWAPLIAAPPYRRVVLSTDATAAAAGVHAWSSTSPAGVEVLRRLWCRLNDVRAVDRFEVEWRSREDPAQQVADAASRLAPVSRPSVVPGLATGTLAVRLARMCVSVFGTDRGLRHDGAVEGYILAPAYTASLPLEPARAHQRRRFLGWPGSVPFADDDIVIVHPVGAPDWERTAALVDAALASDIAGLVVIATGCAISRVTLMVDRWTCMRTRFLLADRGDPVRWPDAAAGGWTEGRAWTPWFAYFFSASGGRMLDGRRSPASAAATPRVSALWCDALSTEKQRRESGDIHPRPGPPKRLARPLPHGDIDGAWGRALAAERLATTAFPTVVGHSPVSGAAPAADGSAPPSVTGSPTMRSVLDALRGRNATAAAAFLASPDVSPALAEAFALGMADADADRAPSTQARADRVANELALAAGALGVAEARWSPLLLDALAVAWVRGRLGLSPTPWATSTSSTAGVPPAPASVAADLGALAARGRRRFPHGIAGCPWPQTGLGPVSRALLDARGAGVRHESSPKRPIWGWELRWGLRNHADVVAAEPVAVAALLVIGASMWRSVYVRTLSTAGLSLAAPGVITLVWAAAHKTNRHVGKPGVPASSRWGFVTAGWVVDFVVERLALTVERSSPDGRTGPAFPSRTHPASPCSWEKLTSVLRRLLAGLPNAETATLHGLRVGHDSEARLAGVPDDVRDCMGWWKRRQRRMSEHYEAIDIAELLAAGRRYGELVVSSVAPGLARVSGSWSAAGPLGQPVGPGGTPYATPLVVRERLGVVFGTPPRPSAPTHSPAAGPPRPAASRIDAAGDPETREAATASRCAGSASPRRSGAPAAAAARPPGRPTERYVPRVPRETVDVESSESSDDSARSTDACGIARRDRGGLDAATLHQLVRDALAAAAPAPPTTAPATGRGLIGDELLTAPGSAGEHR